MPAKKKQLLRKAEHMRAVNLRRLEALRLAKINKGNSTKQKYGFEVLRMSRAAPPFATCSVKEEGGITAVKPSVDHSDGKDMADCQHQLSEDFQCAVGLGRELPNEAREIIAKTMLEEGDLLGINSDRPPDAAVIPENKWQELCDRINAEYSGMKLTPIALLKHWNDMKSALRRLRSGYYSKLSKASIGPQPKEPDFSPVEVLIDDYSTEMTANRSSESRETGFTENETKSPTGEQDEKAIRSEFSLSGQNSQQPQQSQFSTRSQKVMHFQPTIPLKPTVQRQTVFHSKPTTSHENRKRRNELDLNDLYDEQVLGFSSDQSPAFRKEVMEGDVETDEDGLFARSLGVKLRKIPDGPGKDRLKMRLLECFVEYHVADNATGWSRRRKSLRRLDSEGL